MTEVFFELGILSFYDDNQQGWHDNWGLGMRIMVMGMPLRLDFGLPITDPADTGGTSVSFFRGTRF